MRAFSQRWKASTAILGIVLLAACGGGEDAGDSALAGDEGIAVAEVGFQTPESVLHDTAQDRYLVSNINGEPLAKDDNGFISVLDPDGTVQELHWIQGGRDGVVLHAPKGMAIIGDTLFVADIDCVRMFELELAEELGEMCRDGAVFLNDIAVGPNNELFVTDTGSGDEDAMGDQAGAVYRFDSDGSSARLNAGRDMGRPNGIAVGPRGIFVVSFGSGEIAQLDASGQRTVVMPSSDRQLDGIVFLPAGGFLFSSWGDEAVYRVAADGTVRPIFEGIPTPADIGYDIRRNRVLIPVFQEDQVLIRELPM